MKLRVENYKSIESLELELEDVTSSWGRIPLELFSAVAAESSSGNVP